MKVCHLTSVHSIDDVRIFVKECTSLAAHGFDVTLIACGDTAFEDIKNGVKRVSLYVPVKNRLHRMIKRSRAVYKKAIEVDADIYHFHDPELLLVGYMLKKQNKSVIYDVHENVSDQIKSKHYIPTKFLRYLTANVYKLFERLFSTRLDLLVTVTEGVKKSLSHKKVYIVKNLPAVDLIQQSTPAVFKKDTFNVIYPGSLSKTRGILDLVKAMEILKGEATLILYGKWHNEKFKKECINANGWAFVDYRGIATLDTVYSNIKSSDLGVHLVHDTLNYTGGLPVKVFEFMACGIPCIVSDTQSKRELLGDYVFYATPGNPQKIAEAIRNIMNNPVWAKEKAQKSKDFACQNNWEQESKKLVNIYRNLKQ